MPQFHLLIKSGLSKKSSYLAWFHFLQYPIRLTTITVNEGPTEKSDFMTLSTFVFDLTWRRGIQWGCCSGVRWDLRCSKPNDLLKAEEGHVEEPPRLALGWGQGRAFERKWCPLMKKEEQLHSWKGGEGPKGVTAWKWTKAAACLGLQEAHVAGGTGRRWGCGGWLSETWSGRAAGLLTSLTFVPKANEVTDGL